MMNRKHKKPTRFSARTKVKNLFRASAALLLLMSVGALTGCGSDDPGVTFSSEITEEELAELEGRGKGFEASVTAEQGSQAPNIEAPPSITRGTRHVVLALPETRSERRAKLRVALTSRLEKESDISLEVLDAGADPDTQLRQLQQLSANPPAVLLVSAVAANEIGLPIKILIEAGTRVVAIEHALSDCEPTATLHLDNEAIGREIGEFTIRVLRLKQQEENLPSLSGRVVVIRGDETGDTCHLLQAGLNKVLLAHPEVRLVHDAPGFWNQEDTTARFHEAVRLQKEFDVVFAHSDRMARAARAAAQQFDMQQRLLIIGLGGARGHDGGLAAVKRGILGATVQLPDLTEDIIELTLNLVHDASSHPTPTKRELPWTLITGDTLPSDIGTGPLMPAPPLIPPTPTPEDES